MDYIKYSGHVSKFMRALTSKDGDLLSYFNKIEESEAEIENNSPKHHLINNHDVAATKGKIKGQLLLGYIFGFCKSFKMISEQLGFHLTFKTADLQDTIFTTLGCDFKVNFDNSFLYVPMFIPDAQTKIMFNDSIKHSFTLSFDSLSTDSKFVDTQLEYRVDIRSAQNLNSPKCLIVAHQTAVRIGAPNKANNIAAFDNLFVRKYHVDIDGVRYPGDSFSIDYGTNDYVAQYRDPKFF